MSIILTFVIFSIIVVIHEWGHMVVAKKSGVYVEEFAVGMGPKLFGVQKGETLYTLRLLPLGGFCKMADETNTENGITGFNDVNVWKRMAICVAGPFMNFVLALVVMIALSMVTGTSTNNIAGVTENSPAQNAGFSSGDKIVEVNGKSVHILNDLRYIMAETANAPIEITIKRDNQRITKTVTPEFSQETGGYAIGVLMDAKAPLWNIGIYENIPEDMQKASVWESVYDGYWNGIFLVKATLDGFVQIITNAVSVDQLSGPIGVTTVVGDTYEQSKDSGVFAVIVTMANITALLSANLGILNLLPIPALDGGRLLIYVVEVIRRKKIPPEKEGMLNLAGFALLMAFAVFVAFNDVTKLIN